MDKRKTITDEELRRYSKFMREAHNAVTELYKLAEQDPEHRSILIIVSDSSRPGGQVWKHAKCGVNLCKDVAAIFTNDDWSDTVDGIFYEAESMLNPGVSKVKPLDRKIAHDRTSDNYYESWRGACDVIESLNEEKRRLIQEKRRLKEQLNKYKSAYTEFEQRLHWTRRVED
jgi:hypothetical protein